MSLSAKHTAYWNAQMWGIFAVHVALFAPCVAFYVFSTLDYHFGFRLLLWFAFVLTAASLIRSYRFQMYLRWIGTKAYGTRVFK